MTELESLDSFFQAPGKDALPQDITTELESAMRFGSLTPQELFYKWESYSMKMGSDNTVLDYDTVRAFKQDILETIEREARSKNHVRVPDKRAVQATPRAGAAAGDDDMFGMMGVSTTPASRLGSISKRKAQFETPASGLSKTPKATRGSSPTDGRNEESRKTNGIAITPFVERTNAGEVISTLNKHLTAFEPPIAPPGEPRVKLVANTEIKKFAYKPLAMHLSEASEVLDERIDDFLLTIQAHHKLDDDAFGNAASKSTHETVAVGRIASDSPEGKPTEASLVLETSRRTGAGLRVPLRFSPSVTADLFPGQIVALRGKNSSGDYFAVSEILEIPSLHHTASTVRNLEDINERLGYDGEGDASSNSALNFIVASGPYTTDDNLFFEPLHAVCDKAEETSADVLFLVGPLLDIEHPLIATGDFELPEGYDVDPDHATLNDAFRAFVGEPLSKLARSHPNITIILVPSVREAVNKHVSWPQQNLSRKELGLPKQVKTVSNPVIISLNEIMIGISAADILYDIRLEEVNVGRGASGDLMARLPRHIIQQRHFFPMFPPADRSKLPRSGTEEGIATGTPMDISYIKLAEFGKVLPDILILPSALSSFSTVVENVMVINPGSLSRRRGPGQYCQMTIYPRKMTHEERVQPNSLVPNKLYERTRVDIIRI